jgi:heme-degrading monooxygenase HmoA
MVELLTQPPPADAIARMLAIEGVAITPGVLARQQGPDGHLGPEAAGAILVLQATFADEDCFAEFWQHAAALMELLATAPGFIRRYNFADGPHYTLFAFWRSLADAHAFFATDAHQAAMRGLFEHRWQYSHFAGLWETAAPRERVIFCRHCDGVTPASDRVCRGCGTELFDPYTGADHAVG